MTRRPSFLAVLLFAVAAAAASGCTVPPECDPNSDLYDPDDCETAAGALLEYLTWLAYGNPNPPPEPQTTCPERLACFLPECVLAQENGSFEVGPAQQPARWYGDQMALTVVPVCHQNYALSFQATTPEGPGPSASAQVYQIVDYAALLENLDDDALGPAPRVRARAAFGLFVANSDDDRQFGLRIDAYAGSGYPLEGDPETIPVETNTYRRLATAEETLLYGVGGAPWQPLEVGLAVPEGTDFLVVFLEAVENISNDLENEFTNQAVDFVQIGFDGGNTPPVAQPDQQRTREDTPDDLNVLWNDYDPTSRIDETSVEIVGPVQRGTAVVLADGRVRYTPPPGFVGTDRFAYTVADEEGLRSEEAEVEVEVVNVNEAPVALDDVYELSEGGLLLVPAPIGVLANDTDGDGDALTAELVADVQKGTLLLDPTGAFTYQPGAAFDGADAFTYRAADGLTTSEPATVRIVGSGTYDLALQVSTAFPDVAVGIPFTYNVTVTKDPAAEDVPGIAAEHVVPEGLMYLSHTATTGTYDRETGRWSFDLPSQSVVAFLSLRVRADTAGTWRPAARLVGGLDGDRDAGNDADTLEVVVTPRYFLSLTANVSAETATVGDEVLVDVLVSNSAGSVAEGVAATLQLPPGLTYVRDDGGGAYDPQTGVWTIGDLAPGPFVTLRITAQAAAPGTWTSTAAITDGLEYDADFDNNEDTITVTVTDGGT